MSLLLKETENLCIEMKYEAASINHSDYCFGKILDTLRILSIIHSEGTIPHVYIQELYQYRFNKVSYYLFNRRLYIFYLTGEVNLFNNAVQISEFSN